MDCLQEQSNFIKNEALLLGFDAVGIAEATFLEEEKEHLELWLKNGFHGDMQYMENHFEKRLDPRLLVENAKSVIVLTLNYYPKKTLSNSEYKIASYAYGEDYHHIIKTKLHQLLSIIQQKYGAVNGRAFTDSAPVLERTWAKKAGLGWQGKNTLLIQKNKGSYFFLAILMVDIQLAYDTPFTANHCGTCTRCIDACPTQAILPNGVLEARKCIAYLTIELKNEIPTEFKNLWKDWIFGCDICQEVCPWNQFALPNQENRLQPNEFLKQMTLKDWEEITEEVFDKVFQKSALKRTKFKGIQRNIQFLKH